MTGFIKKNLFFLVYGALLLVFSLPLKAEPLSFQLKQGNNLPRLSPQDLVQKMEASLEAKTNQERAKKKLSTLSPDPIFKKAARDHSQDMLKRNYLSHFSPEKKTAVDRVKKHSKRPMRTLGENLHYMESSDGLYDVEAVASLMVSDWMGSKPHRKNILKREYKRLSVGCASNGKKIYCTQVFGTW